MQSRNLAAERERESMVARRGTVVKEGNFVFSI